MLQCSDLSRLYLQQTTAINPYNLDKKSHSPLIPVLLALDYKLM
jgi:hypothetical protein